MPVGFAQEESETVETQRLVLDAKRKRRYQNAGEIKKDPPQDRPKSRDLTPKEFAERKQKLMKGTGRHTTILRGTFKKEEGKLYTIFKAYNTMQEWREKKSWLWWVVVVPFGIMMVLIFILLFVVVLLLLEPEKPIKKGETDVKRGRTEFRSKYWAYMEGPCSGRRERGGVRPAGRKVSGR